MYTLHTSNSFKIMFGKIFGREQKIGGPWPILAKSIPSLF